MLPPYSEFKLADLNIKLEDLLVLYDDLEIDQNDKSLYDISPFRSRKILYTKFLDGCTHILKNKEFVQNVDDKRKEKRKFKEFNPNLEQHKIVDRLIKNISNFFNISQNLEVTYHFVRIYASKNGSSNSPEGIHRDGFDILVPCIVLERENIVEGDSRIFDNGELIYRKIINEGEGLILNEKDYSEMYHDVMPIYKASNNSEGYRTILGIDINLID